MLVLVFALVIHMKETIILLLLEFCNP